MHQSIGQTGGTERLSRDTAYELLSSRRRRNTIHALLEHGSESTVGDLASQLAAWENDCRVRAVTSTQRKRTYTALRQSHLPKLSDAGVVDYDVNRGTVRLTDVGNDLREYLRPQAGRYLHVYAGLVGLATLAVAAAWAGWLSLPATVLSAAITLCFGAATLVFLVRTRGSVLDAAAFQADTLVEPESADRAGSPSAAPSDSDAAGSSSRERVGALADGGPGDE
jgi:hypothetical protein